MLVVKYVKNKLQVLHNPLANKIKKLKILQNQTRWFKLKKNIKLTNMLHNSSVKLRILLKTLVIFNYKFLLTVVMMQYIQEHYTWEAQKVNLLVLSLIQDQNIQLLHQYYVTIKQQEIINSKNMILLVVDLLREINNINVVKLRLTICTNQILIKFYQKHPQS